MFLRCLLLLSGIPLIPGSRSLFRVNVLLHRPVTLLCKTNKTLSITSGGWKYDKNGELGTLMDISANPYRIYPSQFRDRLAVSDDLLILTINDMRMEDSGIISAQFTNTDGKDVSCMFNVTVYEPVPTPSIQITEKIQSGGWCNVTLHCSVSKNTSSLSYSWIYGAYQQSPHSGDTLHLFLRNDSWDSEVLCIVKNPVDQKNTSAQKICSEVDESSSDREGGINKRTYIISVLIGVGVGGAAIGALILFALREWKQKQGSLSEDEKRESQREPQYIQVTMARPHSNNQMVMTENTLYDASPQQKSKTTTVYAEIRHPKGTRG